MKMEEFVDAVKNKDFAVGDSFWLDGVEFEVINKESFSEDACECACEVPCNTCKRKDYEKM